MPLFSFEGVEAKLFQPMAISIMLAAVCRCDRRSGGCTRVASYMFRKGIQAENSFCSTLSHGACLVTEHSRVVVGAAAVLVVLAALVVPRLGEFVPELEGTLTSG